MNGRIAVGVDAGGSATVAARGRGDEPVRTARGGPANPTTIGIADAADIILRTIREVLAGERPDTIYVGAAGAGRAHVAEELRSLVASGYPHADVRVGDDAAIALRSAIDRGPGIVLVAGTGSIAYAEKGDRRARLGGWGSQLGDEGSAFAIGFAAMRLLSRAIDGRSPRDETTALVERTFAITSRDDLIARVYDARLDPARVASLAPVIVAFAGKGNRASTKIVQAAAQELADLARAAARAVSLDAPPVALAGGLLRENSLLTFLLETRIAGDLPGAMIVRDAGDPSLGALRLAQAV